jgi:hypothetical protein
MVAPIKSLILWKVPDCIQLYENNNDKLMAAVLRVLTMIRHDEDGTIVHWQDKQLNRSALPPSMTASELKSFIATTTLKFHKSSL